MAAIDREGSGYEHVRCSPCHLETVCCDVTCTRVCQAGITANLCPPSVDCTYIAPEMVYGPKVGTVTYVLVSDALSVQSTRGKHRHAAILAFSHPLTSMRRHSVRRRARDLQYVLCFDVLPVLSTNGANRCAINPALDAVFNTRRYRLQGAARVRILCHFCPIYQTSSVHNGWECQLCCQSAPPNYSRHL